MAEGMHNITRIDQDKKNTHGYYVRIQRDNNRISTFFSDKKYGGKADALQAAKEYRDRELEKWNKMAKNPDMPISYGKPTNTGELGIIKTTNGREHQFVFNYTDDNGNYTCKTFYISTGKPDDYEERYERKLKDAINFRDQLMHRRYGFRWVNFKKRKKIEHEKLRQQQNGNGTTNGHQNGSAEKSTVNKKAEQLS